MLRIRKISDPNLYIRIKSRIIYQIRNLNLSVPVPLYLKDIFIIFFLQILHLGCSSSVSRQKKKENTVKLDPDYLERYRTIWIRKNGLESHACLCRKWWLKFSPSRRSRITTCATFAERSTRLVPHHFSLQIFWGPFTYIRVVLVNLSLSNLLVSVKKTYCYWNFLNYFSLWPRFRLHKISMAPQASAVQNSSSLCSGASGADLFLGAGAVISYFGNGPVAE